MHDRMQRIEQEMRMQLRAQRIQLRARGMRLDLGCALRSKIRVGHARDHDIEPYPGDDESANTRADGDGQMADDKTVDHADQHPPGQRIRSGSYYVGRDEA